MVISVPLVATKKIIQPQIITEGGYECGVERFWKEAVWYV